jgi:excisionase family DNA binding protein
MSSVLPNQGVLFALDAPSAEVEEDPRNSVTRSQESASAQPVKADSPAPDLIRVPEAARRLGVSSETLYRHIRRGQFEPAVRIGRSIRISVPLLEALLHGDAPATGRGRVERP